MPPAPERDVGERVHALNAIRGEALGVEAVGILEDLGDPMRDRR